MSAEVLRRAAALMRERADEVTPGPWALDEDETCVRARRGAGPTVVQTIPLGYHERRANATHIASWHPAVALAVAAWLEKEADWTDIGAANSPDDEALAVARAYLGRTD